MKTPPTQTSKVAPNRASRSQRRRPSCRPRALAMNSELKIIIPAVGRLTSNLGSSVHCGQSRPAMLYRLVLYSATHNEVRLK